MQIAKAGIGTDRIMSAVLRICYRFVLSRMMQVLSLRICERLSCGTFWYYPC